MHNTPSRPDNYIPLPYTETMSDIRKRQSDQNEFRKMVLKHYDRRAENTMKYETWSKYVKSELIICRRQSYRLIYAARIEAAIGLPEAAHLPERTLREMMPIREDTDKIRSAFAYAQHLAATLEYPEGPAQMHHGKLTSKVMARAVRYILGIPEPDKQPEEFKRLQSVKHYPGLGLIQIVLRVNGKLIVEYYKPEDVIESTDDEMPIEPEESDEPTTAS